MEPKDNRTNAIEVTCGWGESEYVFTYEEARDTALRLSQKKCNEYQCYFLGVMIGETRFTGFSSVQGGGYEERYEYREVAPTRDEVNYALYPELMNDE